MKLFTLALGIVIAVSSCFARIGETKAEIEARYGKALSSSSGPGTPIFLYRKSGMQIGVVFIKGKSAAEFYSRIDKHGLSENEIKLLLDANSFNGQWVKSEGPSTWKLEPSGYLATRTSESLVIHTPEFVEMSKEEREKAEAAKLKNF